MSLSKLWQFTLNNWSPEELLALQTIFDREDCPLSYLCFQQEVGETGTPHLQGFAAFKDRKRLPTVKSVISPRAHIERVKGTVKQNIKYCSKSDTSVVGTFQQYGEVPVTNQGSRNDLELFKTAVKDGERSAKRLREDFSDTWRKHSRFCLDYLHDHEEIKPVEDHPFRPWQTNLTSILSGPPDDRTVIFVVDREGNQGKTWYARHHCQLNPTSQYMEPGKKVDMAYSLRTDIRVLFLNISRAISKDAKQYLYPFLESVKDGMVFSPKYESRMKSLDKLHIVVMMNETPDLEMLSQDRYHIIDLDETIPQYASRFTPPN